MDNLIVSANDPSVRTAAMQFEGAEAGGMELDCYYPTPDIYFFERNSVESNPPPATIYVMFAGDAHKLSAPASYRRADIHLHAHSFGIPRCGIYDIVVYYHPDIKFNIELPATDTNWQIPTVYDTIWELRNREVNKDTSNYNFDTIHPLPDDVKAWLPKLPTGYSLADLYRFSEEMQQALNFEQWYKYVYRLAWCTAAPNTYSNSVLGIHPFHHRPLTLGELAFISGYHGRITNTGVFHVPHNDAESDNAPWWITNCYPTPIAAWLLRQCYYALHGAWEGEDWQLSYQHVGNIKHHNKRKEGWICEYTDDQKVKHFGLLDYRPQAYDFDRFPIEAKTQMYRHMIGSK